jgi:hypothetical protein
MALYYYHETPRYLPILFAGELAMNELNIKVKNIMLLRSIYKVRSSKRMAQLHRRVLRAYGYVNLSGEC